MLICVRARESIGESGYHAAYLLQNFASSETADSTIGNAQNVRSARVFFSRHHALKPERSIFWTEPNPDRIEQSRPAQLAGPLDLIEKSARHVFQRAG